MELKYQTTMRPKPCPICSVAMQAAETEERIIHQCNNCGMKITVLLPIMPVTRDR